MLDGVDIRTLDLSWLRGQIVGFINQVLTIYATLDWKCPDAASLSPQEPVLFGSSIMDNIRFGKPEATEAEVIYAAEQANAHRFITAFPDGYNTIVGMFRFRDILARFAFHFDAEPHTQPIQVREV